MAVARSRAKQSKRLQDLQLKVEKLVQEKNLLSQELAISQVESRAAELRMRELEERARKLEALLLENKS